jgi:hypothetical protein
VVAFEGTIRKDEGSLRSCGLGDAHIACVKALVDILQIDPNTHTYALKGDGGVCDSREGLGGMCVGAYDAWTNNQMAQACVAIANALM